MTPEQIATVVEEIRERVRGRHQTSVPELPDLELPALDPLGHARDAAEGKAASIGTVNPRPRGLVNDSIQACKKTLARLLNWMVRDQVDFNQAVLTYMDRNLEVAIEQNYAMLRLGKGLVELERQARRLDALAGDQADLLRHWNEWRPAWEEKLTQVEIRFLHILREAESGAREREQKMHQEYRAALDGSAAKVQQKLWDDLAKLKAEQERLIHTELRLIRRRAGAPSTEPAVTAGAPGPAATGGERAPAPAVSNGGASQPYPAQFDYSRFEERFRGDEDYVGETQQLYLDRFRGCRRVVDLGCGRGEFLEILRQASIPAIGVDQDPEAIAACREKGLEARQADLFEFLAGEPPGSMDGIFCAHVVEHLPPLRLPQLVSLAAEKLAPGGTLAIETPNPGCLAIAGDFYLDPTHVRPVPPNQLHFYFEEAGLGQIEIQELHPATEVFPEIAALDQIEQLRAFRRKFFGGLDYAIVGRKLKP